MLAYVIHPQNTKNRLCVCARCTLWYDSVRFIIMTDSFLCPQIDSTLRRGAYNRVRGGLIFPGGLLQDVSFQGKVLKNICWDIRITGYLTFNFTAHLKSRNAHKSKETSYLFYIYLRIDYQLINPLSLKTNRRYLIIFFSLAWQDSGLGTNVRVTICIFISSVVSGEYFIKD